MDEREFESFVLARTPALLRTAYLLCGDQQLAEDLGPIDETRASRHGTLRAVESDAAEARVMVREASRALAPRQRAVLVLRFFEDLTERDTAAALGCSVGTVMTQSRKALKRLVERCPELADLGATRREA